MPKKPTYVKVSGLVEHATHEAMTTLAQQERTTIGAIVSFAVPLALRELASNPQALGALGRDRRLPEAS